MDRSNYITKADLKRVTSVDTSTLAAKTDLVTLKVGVDKWDANELNIVLADLSKLINVVDNDVDKNVIWTGYQSQRYWY